MTSRLLASQVLICCIAVPLAAGCNRSAEPGTTKSTTDDSESLVRVTPVRPVRKTLVRRTEQPGKIEAFEEAPLFAKLSGFVEKVHVDIDDKVTGPREDHEGKQVEAGQLLAELSIPELAEEQLQKEALVAQAQSEIQQATAAIKVAEAAQTSASAKVEEAEAVTVRTDADFQRYKSELERITHLAESGAVTQQLVDEKENLFRAADAARAETAAKIRAAQAQFSESQAHMEKALADRDSARAKLKVAQADRKRIAALLGYSKIRAPFDGVVSARNIHTGHLVAAATGTSGQPLFVVVRTNIVRIFVDVPESDAVLVQLDAEAKIRVPALQGEVFPGKVARTSWVLSADTGTLRAEIDIENSDGRLRPGMYAHADLKVAERQGALVLPKGAVQTAEGRSFCLCIEGDGKVVRREIVTGIRAGDEVEIVSGLTGDEQVIAANAASFHEGQRVEVVVEPAKKPK